MTVKQFNYAVTSTIKIKYKKLKSELREKSSSILMQNEN